MSDEKSIYALLGDPSRTHTLVRCPHCFRGEHTHTDKIEVVRGHDDYRAWGGRGDLIVIHMWDDSCRHRWEVCIGFHKGQQSIFVRNCAEMERGEERAREITDIARANDPLTLPTTEGHCGV